MLEKPTILNRQYLITGIFEDTSYRYCPENSKRGRYYAQIIRAGKLEARPFFFMNFKWTPSQEEQKTIFSGLTI
jgi:hypothetical protein